MAVVCPTGTYTVTDPDHTVRGPLPGNADPIPIRRRSQAAGPSDATGDGLNGLWALQLDPGLWPVTEATIVTHVESGRAYTVRSAAYLAGRTGRLAHISIVAEQPTNDRREAVVDSEGTVLAPAGPVESPIGSAH